jgi:ribosomal protein L29
LLVHEGITNLIFSLLQKELAQLRVSKVSSQPQVKLTKIKQVRKNVAKVLTVLSEKRI